MEERIENYRTFAPFLNFLGDQFVFRDQPTSIKRTSFWANVSFERYGWQFSLARTEREILSRFMSIVKRIREERKAHRKVSVNDQWN